MAKTAQIKKTSKGTCNFCHDEFDKGKMTQHLKHCKQRDAMTKQADTGSEKKTKIFHILVEGKYLPMYWMHLEMPAKATLENLDNFLRGMWLECCDHLSEFKIGKTSYTSSPPDFGMAMFGDPLVTEGVLVEEHEEDMVDEDDEDEDELTPEEESQLIKEMGYELVAIVSAAFPQGLANASTNDVAAKITEMMLETGNVSPSDIASPEWQEEVGAIARLIQSGMFELALGMYSDVGEQDMDVRLRKALQVGTKFSHTYDFGSSTYLSLKVISEREGVMTNVNDDDDTIVQIMAINEQPDIPCCICGKPATRIIPGYYSAWDGALCDTCTPNRDEEDYVDEESFLPIVNSPRVGVCGYTGGEGMWIDDDDEPDEREDEEDE